MLVDRKIVAKLCFLIVILVAASSFFINSAPSVAQNQGSPYETIDKRAGVWNDGQAALWDLNVLDHYRIFGFPEKARGYAPQQPINFSHVIHVQKNKMECQYCHYTVTKSSFAAIPEVSACMGCHKIIKTESPEIQKLAKYYADGEPVPWVKVHVTPDHVKFNHKRHIKGGVGCQQCHGQVPAMDKVERVSSFKMGFCLDCHRAKGASIDCLTCHG